MNCSVVTENGLNLSGTNISDTDILLVAPHHSDDLCGSLDLQRSNAEFTDITIDCADGKIHAHSCILASADSEPIMAILKEGINSIDTFKFSSFIWKTILRMLYTGKVQCPVDSLLQLKTAFTRLGMRRMTALCAAAELRASKPRDLDALIRRRADLVAGERYQLTASNLRYKCVKCDLLYVSRDAKLRHQRHAHNADICRDPTPHQRRGAGAGSKPLVRKGIGGGGGGKPAGGASGSDSLTRSSSQGEEEEEEEDEDDSDGSEGSQSDKPAPFMELIDARQSLYRCKICDTNFIPRRNVKRHEDSHSKEMVTKDTYAKELYKPEAPQFHNGKRIYKCDICDKHFPNGKNISRHKRTRHGVDVLGFPIAKDKPNGNQLVPCPICGKAFSSQRNLRCHQSRVHKVDKVDIYNSKLQKSILESSYESSQDLNLESSTMYDTPPSSSAVFPEQP